MKLGFFVTGTDTDCGKTTVSLALLKVARTKGFQTAAYKPLASGGEFKQGQWQNADAVALQQASTQILPYEQVNPWNFQWPMAPHLAAANQGRKIEFDEVEFFLKRCFARRFTLSESFHPEASIKAHKSLSKERPKKCPKKPSDNAIANRIFVDSEHSFPEPVYADSHAKKMVLIEGAGGWRLPLDGAFYLGNAVVRAKIPVLMVVGMRVGCINHAILTAEAMLKDQANSLGWIANRLDPQMPYYDAHILDLQKRLPMPFLGEHPYGDMTTQQADALWKSLIGVC